MPNEKDDTRFPGWVKTKEIAAGALYLQLFSIRGGGRAQGEEQADWKESMSTLGSHPSTTHLFIWGRHCQCILYVYTEILSKCMNFLEKKMIIQGPTSKVGILISWCLAITSLEWMASFSTPGDQKKISMWWAVFTRSLWHVTQHFIS